MEGFGGAGVAVICEPKGLWAPRRGIVTEESGCRARLDTLPIVGESEELRDRSVTDILEASEAGDLMMMCVASASGLGAGEDIDSRVDPSTMSARGLTDGALFGPSEGLVGASG